MMTVKEFIEAYNVSKSTIYAHYRYKHPCIKKIRYTTYIDTNCISKRKEFISYVYSKAADNYYKLTENLTESEAAKLLANASDTAPRVWYNLFKSSLFVIPKDSPFIYKPASRVYAFLLLSEYLLSIDYINTYSIEGDVNEGKK